MTVSLRLHPREREGLRLLGIALLVGVVCWASLVATRDAGRIAAIWIANGILLGLLLNAPPATWMRQIVAGYAGNVLAYLVLGDPPGLALAVAACNSLEVGLAAGALRRMQAPRVDLTDWRALRAFVGGSVVAAPLLSGTCAGLVLQLHGKAAFLDVFAVWVPSDALGIAIVTPLMLAVAQEWPALRGRQQQSWALSTSLLAVVAAAVFLNREPTLFLILPPLMYVVFGHGYLGAAVGIAVIAVLSVGLTLQGYGPIATAESSSVTARVLLLQVFIAVCSVMALGAAVVLQQRRRAQERVAKMERDLRTITDNLPALIAHVDDQERYRFVNAHIGRVFGGDAQATIGRTMREIRGEAIYADIAPHVAEVLSGKPVSFESIASLQGRTYHYQSNYIPEIGEDGAVRGFYAMTFDITARKEAELKLARSERWLKAITENIPALIAYVDRDQRYQFANGYYRTFFGVDPDAFIGRTVRENLGGDPAYQQLAGPIEAVLRGEKVRFEHHGTERGEDFHALVDYVPDRDAQGGVRGFFVSVMDITARKNAELRQAASEARLRTITDGLPGLIAYIDRTERLRFCNATFEPWFGIRPHDMIDRTFDEALGGRLLHPQTDAVRAALAGERVEAEFDVEHQGQRRSLQATYLPHRDPDGRILGVYTLASDVTPLKRVQKQLTQLARYDSLTGLPNRGEFNRLLEAAIGRAHRLDGYVGLMFIDVDHFKSINDQYGHPAGDEVLQEVAIRLQGGVRDSDTVARLAGDEFVVILENIKGDNEAQFVARKILSSIGRPIVHHESELRIGISIGIALHMDPARPASDLLGHADQALYAAKAAGRNTYRVFENATGRVRDAMH